MEVDGEVKFPVTTTLWFSILTVTLSPSLTSDTVSTGVNMSEPSILTHVSSLLIVIVPYRVVVWSFSSY